MYSAAGTFQRSFQVGFDVSGLGAAGSVDGAHRVTLGAGESAVDLDFGNVRTVGSIAGTKFEDVNGNGERDAGEGPLAGVTVYLDENDNGVFDDGELSATTDTNGEFLFADIPTDEYIVREVIPTGFTQTAPATHDAFYYAAAGQANELITIDAATGQVDHIGLFQADIHGLTHTRNGDLFALRGADPDGFYSVDTTTGAATLIGETGQVVFGLAYDDATDTIYTVRGLGNTRNLATIDRATGETTVIGPGSGAVASVSGIAFDAANNRVIAFDNGDDEFWGYDVTTGVATLLSTAPGFRAFGFTHDGTNFVMSTTAGNLSIVDPNTGNTSHTLTMSETLGIDALTHVAASDGSHRVTVAANSVRDQVDFGNSRNALTVAIADASISENGGITTATVTRNTDTTNPLTVTLLSDDTSEATVVGSVTIAAGQTTSPAFQIDAVNDLVADGIQTVTITAAAPDHADGADTLDVEDDEIASLTLSIDPASISENGGTATGTVSRNDADLSAPLVVNLASTDTTEATVPATVTIPAGQSSVDFTVTAVDDAIDDGTQVLRIGATATGYSGFSAGVNVTDDDNPALTLIIDPASISENGGTATATVSRNDADLSAPLVVNLASTDTTEATVPATVTIPAGQSSVDFTVTAVDDDIDDGTQVLSIGATATGYNGFSAGMNVTDDDNPALTLSIDPASISENGGTATGTVFRNDADLSSPLLVNLASTDTTEATVPATVTIPAGQSSVDFTVTAVDDDIDDGTQVLSIGATATGYNGFSAGMNVTDDDNPALTLSIDPAAISENGGTATGTVSRNDADLSSPLVVNLASTDTTEATVPATVTIPAGQSSVDFTVTAVDDDIDDGTQILSIGATATGYNGFSAGMNVTDDDHPALTLSIDPVSISENGGTATGTVSRNDADLSAPLVVNLASTDTTEATVPATVTIPAGQSSVDFTVTAVDDAIDDGTQVLSIGATATGYNGFSAGMNVTDDDNPALTLSIDPAAISENGGTATGTVSRNDADLSSPLLVNLASTDTTEATVPATVAIPAGQSSVDFTVTAVDDDIDDGTQVLSIGATATGYNGFSAGMNVTDDDNPALTLSIDPASISENGGTATGTVSRNDADLSAPLVVNLASTDTTEATVPATVTIPAGQSSVDFTVTAVDDDIDDGTQVLSIGATATGYNGFSAGMNVTDDDNPALTLIIDPASISENGGTATGTVSRNDADPSAPLVVSLASTDTTEATVPATVTIPAGQSSVDFTVTAVDDDIDDGTQVLSIGATATGYNGFSAGMNVTDDDNPALTLIIDPASISENGGTATGTVSRNDADLSAPLVVNLASTDTTEATVPATVTIPAGQSSVDFTVTAVDDDIDDGTQVLSIGATATGYNGFSAGMNVTDDDVAGFITSPNTGLVVEEGGATDSVDFVLTSQPTADVTFDVDNGSSEHTTFSQTTFTFTPANWDIPQELVVTAIDDDVDEQTFGIAVLPQPAVSADLNYDGRKPQGANGSVLDNDTRGVTVSTISGSTTEAGGTATFSIVLNSEPTSAVEIPLSSIDTGEGTLSVSSVTFSPTNWNTAQVVTVTGADDNIVDGDIGYSIVTGTIGGDSDYAQIDPDDVSAVNEDDDVATLTLSIDAAAISENGGAAIGTVTRNTDTTGPLTVTLQSDDTSEATVPATVTIPAGAASTSFDITGVDDAVIDGTQTVTINASEAQHASGSDSVDVTDDDDNANNVAPEIASISDTAKTRPGQDVTVTATFTDENPLDVHTATIDWGDGTVTTGVVIEADGSGTVSGTHQYADGGLYTVTVTVDDGQDGSDSATTTSLVSGVGLVDGVLYVIGTDGRDDIDIKLKGNRHNPKLNVKAKLNKGRHQIRINENFDPDDVQRIVVIACDGDDKVRIEHDASDGVVDIPAMILGGDGNDQLDGGNGSDIIVGGGGKDQISGRGGRDVLIGGTGKDDLRGGNGQDILIGGFTVHDHSLDSLDAVFQEWTANAHYCDRVDALRNGSGATGISLKAGVDVFDDNDQDKMDGQRHRDWYFGDLDRRRHDNDKIQFGSWWEKFDQI